MTYSNSFRRKRALALAVCLAVMAGWLVGQSQSVFADNHHLVNIDFEGTSTVRATNLEQRCGTDERKDKYLLGILPTWDRGIGRCDDLDLLSEFEHPNKIPIILGNMVSILIRLAAMVAVGAAIAAGFRYSISGGDSGRTAGALQSLLHALSGLAIAVGATVIVDTIHRRLATSGLEDAHGSSGFGTPLPTIEPTITDIIGFVMIIAGLVALLMVVLQGIRLALSQGKPDKTAQARSGLIYAVVGLVVSFASWSLVEFVLGRLVVEQSSPTDPGGSGVSGLLGSVVGIMIFAAGIISLIMVFIGGYKYIFSGGSSDGSASGRQTIIYAMVGLVISAMAGPILVWILSRL